MHRGCMHRCLQEWIYQSFVTSGKCFLGISCLFHDWHLENYLSRIVVSRKHVNGLR